MNTEQVLRRSRRKEFVGIVTSDKMFKTRIVEVTRLTKHPKYNKFIHNRQKFKAHDEKNESRTGDKVRIIETRPLSRDKRFRLTEIIAKAQVLEEADDL